jgi:hypothetical protein
VYANMYRYGLVAYVGARQQDRLAGEAQGQYIYHSCCAAGGAAEQADAQQLAASAGPRLTAIAHMHCFFLVRFGTVQDRLSRLHVSDAGFCGGGGGGG